MGRAPRPKPSRLGAKLLQVRTGLGLSQTQMCRALDLAVDYSAISQYELNTREPPLPVLLRYAELANVYVDALIDDRVNLPAKLPSRVKSEGVRRVSSGKRKR
jgi:transcriptional regulator with XRE-family HTH domain